MKFFSAEYLLKIGADIIIGCGSPPEEAAIVADELTTANLMGLDSHGVMRYIQYVDMVLTGKPCKAVPGAPVRVVKETATTAIVDCNNNFGAVGASLMVDIACKKAKTSSIACVASRNNNHTGRLGSWVQKAAERGLLALAWSNSPRHGHWVVPWGGRKARLATNPLAYAAPTSGWPVVMDMSTSAIAEGKVRMHKYKGKPLPPDRIQDVNGKASTNPDELYDDKMGQRGAILPFGGDLGYKGYGLSLLVEIMSGILVGDASTDIRNHINGFCLVAIDPDAFCGTRRFIELMDDLCSYQTSTPPAPGFDEVVMPGTYDFRMREKRLAEGIPIDDNVWKMIVQAAKRVGVTISEPSEAGAIISTHQLSHKTARNCTPP